MLACAVLKLADEVLWSAGDREWLEHGIPLPAGVGRMPVPDVFRQSNTGPSLAGDIRKPGNFVRMDIITVYGHKYFAGKESNFAESSPDFSGKQSNFAGQPAAVAGRESNGAGYSSTVAGGEPGFAPWLSAAAGRVCEAAG